MTGAYLHLIHVKCEMLTWGGSYARLRVNKRLCLQTSWTGCCCRWRWLDQSTNWKLQWFYEYDTGYSSKVIRYQ